MPDHKNATGWAKILPHYKTCLAWLTFYQSNRTSAKCRREKLIMLKLRNTSVSVVTETRTPFLTREQYLHTEIGEFFSSVEQSLKCFPLFLGVVECFKKIWYPLKVYTIATFSHSPLSLFPSPRVVYSPTWTPIATDSDPTITRYQSTVHSQPDPPTISETAP